MTLDYRKVARYFEEASQEMRTPHPPLTEEETFRVALELHVVAQKFAHMASIPELATMDGLMNPSSERLLDMDGDG